MERDILVAIENVKSRLKEAQTTMEAQKLTQDLIALYVCLEIEVEQRMAA